MPFSIFDCRAALPLLRQRLVQRQASGADPSKVDVTVLEGLIAADERLEERQHAVAIIVNAAQPASSTALVQRWLTAATQRKERGVDDAGP